MDGRNGVQKSGRLMSSQLQQELSGFEERGLRSSRTRIPGKSYLPKVLLSSNPLVERDLQKTLSQIHLGQTRRQKTWEWNQRHFFVSQIFDPEYNLRFTRGLKKYSADLDRRDIVHSRRPSRFRLDEPEEVDVADEDIIGLGVFMPPLHPSQRLIEKQKIPNASVNGRKASTGIRGSMSSPDLSSNKEKYVNGPGQKIYREKRINGTDIERRDDAKDDKGNKTRHRRVTLASAKCSSSTGKLHKAASLPEIPLYRPVTFDAPQKTGLEEETGFMSGRRFSRQNSQQEILCRDHVIVNLTRSLPLSVMIKANQNINKVVQRRKAAMIERCKTARDKNSFEDPRWKELESVLEAPNQT